MLDRARRPGRSIGSLARGLQDFFTERRLAPPTDHPERLAAGRRQRRIDATPEELRPAVQAFAASLLQNRRRARAAATRPRTDHTIEEALRTMRDLAVFLTSHRNKADWALVDQQDIEAFIAAAPGTGKTRLTFARQFFRFARTRRIILIDPTRTLSVPTPRGFTGTTLTLDQQRDLFHRWTSHPTVHPHEALLGVLALLHGAASIEVRTIRLDDIDTRRRTVRLGHRPQPVPLDPTTWSVLERCLAHRQSQRTQNPHLVVTRGTKAGNQPASTAYFSHLLDPAGVPARTVRCTRLAALVNTTDPKLVAAAFGIEHPRRHVLHRRPSRQHPTCDRTRNVSPATRIGSREHVRFSRFAVAGPDRGRFLVPLHDQFVEVRGRGGIQRPEGEVVDDEQVEAGQSAEFGVQGVVEPGGA